MAPRNTEPFHGQGRLRTRDQQLTNHLTRLIHYDWLQPGKIIHDNRVTFGDLARMVGARILHRRCHGGASRPLSPRAMILMVGLSLALGAGNARAAEGAPAGPSIQTNSGHAVHDLGLLPSSPNSDSSTQPSTSASAVSSAEPVPELPTWAMMLLCLAGLGLAGFRKGRKNRLSPGIE